MLTRLGNGSIQNEEKWPRCESKSYSFLQAGITMASITVGVLALQGAFYEHIQLLKKAVSEQSSTTQWEFIEVRTPQELDRCDALILPGGESTTISLVAARSNLLEPLRDFVKYVRAITPSLARQCD
jgi:putative intracellular protease/amidase